MEAVVLDVNKRLGYIAVKSTQPSNAGATCPFVLVHESLVSDPGIWTQLFGARASLEMQSRP